MAQKEIDVREVVYKHTDDIKYETSSEGLITVLEAQDKTIQKIFRKLGFKIPQYKKTQLDKYSSFVFLQIDGKQSIFDIATKMKEEFGEDAEPVYERLMLFLDYIEKTSKYIYKI